MTFTIGPEERLCFEGGAFECIYSFRAADDGLITQEARAYVIVIEYVFLACHMRLIPQHPLNFYYYYLQLLSRCCLWRFMLSLKINVEGGYWSCTQVVPLFLDYYSVQEFNQHQRLLVLVVAVLCHKNLEYLIFARGVWLEFRIKTSRVDGLGL